MSDETESDYLEYELDNMKAMENGTYVGWWSENYGRDHRHLLIEIGNHTVNICSCEGERGHKRINFVTGREKAIEIARDMMKALGIEEKKS